MKRLFLFVFIGLAIVQAGCSKHSETGIQGILSSGEPPVGVVFEISSEDDEGLKWALPLVLSYSNQLRGKFPEIKLAIVFHGEEQFQLTKESSPYFPDAHKQVKSLIRNQGIDVHVCGNYAASAGFSEDDFVDYIDVADRGPAQVNSYENAGYVVLFISKPVEN